MGAPKEGEFVRVELEGEVTHVDEYGGFSLRTDAGWTHNVGPRIAKYTKVTSRPLPSEPGVYTDSIGDLWHLDADENWTVLTVNERAGVAGSTAREYFKTPKHWQPMRKVYL